MIELKPSQIEVECPCGNTKVFYKSKVKGNQGKYCSKSCAKTYGHPKIKPKKESIITINHIGDSNWYRSS